MGHPSSLQPPVITALNPYRVSPEVIQKVEEGLNWRDRLNRPVPTATATAAASQPAPAMVSEPVHPQTVRVPTPQPQQPDFPYLRPAGPAAHAYGDEDALLDDDQRIIAHESVIVEDSSWWRMLIDTLKWVVLSGLGLAAIGGAVAVNLKAKDASVISNGTLVGDFTRLSIILAAVGLVFVVTSIMLILKRLGGIRNP
jgi:hypothetical protein